jgi:hypothetical protein
MPAARAVSVLIFAALVLTACGSAGPTPAPATAVPAASTAAVASAVPAASTSAIVEPTSGAATAVTPAPTSAPTPAPTAPPVDASNAFVKTMSALRATVAIDGAGSTKSTTSKIAGSMAVSGESSDVEQTTTTGKARVKTHVITAANVRYTSRYELWFDSGAPADDDLPALLTSIDGGVTDTGVETRTGQELHHLAITPPATAAAAIGVPAKGSSDVLVTMDAWVQEDGTPVFMTLGATWRQAVGKKQVDATRTLELAFSEVGQAITVSAPAQVWTMHASKLYGYNVAYPSDWVFQKGKKKGKTFWPDAYWGYESDVSFVGSASSGGTSLGYLSSHVTRFMTTVWGVSGVKVTSNKPAKMGRIGARRIELSYKSKKQRYYAVIYLTVKGGTFYYIEYRSDAKLTAADKDTAAGFARSFSLR